MILIQIQQEIFLYRPVNTDKPNFVSFLYLLVQLLHLPLKFHLSKVSRNQRHFESRAKTVSMQCKNIPSYGSQSKRAQSKHIFARSFEEVGFVCMFACFERSSNTFCCQYLSQNSDLSFLFLRSFVCLPQFISIQSRQTANYLSC